MSRLTQFCIGIAVASCMPGCADAAREGNALPLLLGGLCAVLPDLLGAFESKPLPNNTATITPDPLDQHPQRIAEGIADALRMPYDTGRALTLCLNPIQMDYGTWRAYRISFLQNPRRVRVSFPEHALSADARLYGPVRCAGSATADVREGRPLSLHFAPCADELIMRSQRKPTLDWSHGIGVCLALALAVALIFDRLSGTVAFVCFCAHLLIDQIGHGGRTWLAPFVADGKPGWRWLPKTSARMDVLTVLGCTAVTLIRLV